MKNGIERIGIRRRHFKILVFFSLCFWLCQSHSEISAQQRQSFAVLNIDTKGLSIDAADFGNMVRLELEKNKDFNVMDRYEMADVLATNGVDISNCFGKSCLVEIGQILRVDNMLTGNADLINDKIVLTLRLVDVASEEIVRSNVMEYIDREELLNRMVSVSINNLFEIQNDQVVVEQLTQVEEPIAPLTSSYKLSGPRIGMAYVTGDLNETIQRPRNKGGFDGYPYLSQIGYQFEVQYLSAGNFLSLIEFLVMLSGMEQQMFIPTLVFTNGFRLSKQGLEIAFGPTISLRRQAQGFYDYLGWMDGDAGEWYLVNEWNEAFPGSDNPYKDEFVDRMDSRGDMVISAGWVWAIGKTFHSGYLNIPLNIYVSPNKEGWYVGFSLGFNVSKKN